MSTATVSLQSPETLLSDIQIWSNSGILQPIANSELQYISRVHHRKIPLYLVTGGPYDIYTQDHATETYFYDKIVCLEGNIGILAKFQAESSDSYAVFYVERTPSPRIRCYLIDFSVLQKATVFRDLVGENHDESTYIAAKFRGTGAKTDTSVFDRVLELKTLKKQANTNLVPVPQPPAPVSLELTSSHQISQAISRVVLSGLRLRGLSTNAQSSNKDKIAIREIYHMTKKAALFALRKHNYDFNVGSGANPGVRLAEIQSIVESLLQTFVDIDTTSFTG